MQIKFKHVSGPTPQEFAQDINFKFISIKDGLSTLARGAVSHMHSTIKGSKKRSGSNNKLENAIKVEVVIDDENERKLGIGNIDWLNRFSPFWYFLNYGISQKGMTIPGRGKKVGGFFGSSDAPDSNLAGTGVGTDGFTHQRNTYIMQAKNPITPVLYIEKTVNWLKSVWKVYCTKKLRSPRIRAGTTIVKV